MTILLFHTMMPTKMTTQNNIIRYIEYGTEIVFKNDQYITLVTFEFYPNKDSNNLNVYENLKKVFAAMESVDFTSKVVTNSGRTFENPNELPEGEDFISNFPMTNKLQKLYHPSA